MLEEVTHELGGDELSVDAAGWYLHHRPFQRHCGRRPGSRQRVFSSAPRTEKNDSFLLKFTDAPPLPPGPAFAIDDVAITEGDTSAQASPGFTVTRSGDTSVAASVDYATVADTATAGVDFVSAADTLNFAAGETKPDDRRHDHRRHRPGGPRDVSSSTSAILPRGHRSTTARAWERSWMTKSPRGTKFFVVDDGGDKTFEYDAAFGPLASEDWSLANVDARGGRGQRRWTDRLGDRRRQECPRLRWRRRRARFLVGKGRAEDADGDRRLRR